MAKKSKDAGFKFVLRPEIFCVYRLPPDRPLDLSALRDVPWYSLTRTEDELSVVVPEEVNLEPGDREGGWSCLGIDGTLEFTQVGVIAAVAKVVAEAGISLFAVSTYNTDYLLIKTVDITTAVDALTAAGHEVIFNS